MSARHLACRQDDPVPRPRRARRQLALAGCSGLLLAGLLSTWATAAVAATSGALAVSFAGSASSDGFRTTLTIPGAPVADQLVDLAGPSAQAAADTLGTSTGYAALPYPGSVTTSATGLLTGLLCQGAGGLPPVCLPQLPSYPLQVTSSVNGKHDVSAGAGPYVLTAHSDTSGSNASAVGGVQSGVSGNAGLMTSTASVAPGPDKTVVATATSDIQSITAGPLSIGEIKSIATETLSNDGTITATTSIAITGVAVGGAAVTVDGDGLTTPGPPVPLPINSTLKQLLSASGITVELAPARKLKGRVIAPAVLITMPVDTSIGIQPGNLSVTFGGATAALSGASFGPTTGETKPLDTTTPVVGGTDPAMSPLLPGPPSVSGVTAPGPVQSGASPEIAVPQTQYANPVATAERTALVGLFDIRSLYLAVIACGLGAFSITQLVRYLGVRT
jgi:hypothetical protein